MRRAARIVPLYYTVTLLVVFVMVVTPTMLVTGKFSLSQTLGSFFFLGLPDTANLPYPVVRVGWTLNLEMLFYAIFAISLFFARRWRIVFVTTVFLAIIIIGSKVAPQNLWTDIYMSSALLEFSYGMMIAEAYRKGYLNKIGPWVAGGMLAAGLIALTFTAPNAPMRGILVGPAASVVFLGTLCLEKFQKNPSKLFKLLGDASYSVYLTHLISLSASFQIWRALHLPLTANALLIFMPIAVLLSLIAGLGIYRLIEVPLTEYFQQVLKNKTQNRSTHTVPVSQSSK